MIPANIENDARALERRADYLRTFGLPSEEAEADDLDREAMAMRKAARTGRKAA